MTSVPRRYRAPSQDGAILVEPPIEALTSLVSTNRVALDTASVSIDGIPLPTLRAQAREELFQCLGIATPTGPLIMGGHQPELFHPGVWAKNFALAGLARKVGGTALNLIVDNDTVKTTALRFPTWQGNDPATVHWQNVPFDRFEGEAPYETRSIHDPELFRSFAERSRPLWEQWPYVPLLAEVWPKIVAHPGRTLGEKFAGVRQDYERRWGCANLELPVNQLARTRSFAHFVRHLTRDWPAFRDAYNRAVTRYRQAHGIENDRHPVPNLGDDELPFWGPVDAQGRRQRVRVQDHLDPSILRPRALTLTLFVRLCLADLFLHGIGGGKYDEVTDELIREAFGLTPPGYGVVSATLYLPLPTYLGTSDRLRTLTHEVRDRYWNPQRYVTDLAAMVAARARLVAEEPTERRDRRAWFASLRWITDQIRQGVEPEIASREAERARVATEVTANARLRRRDYSWLLYPEAPLGEALSRLQHRFAT